MTELKIKCPKCNGYLLLRSGKYGDFVGCSNFPNCRNSMSINNLIYLFYKQYGFNLYGWNIKCWKCGKETKVYSYFPLYDLSFCDEHFGYYAGKGLGDLPSIDKYLIENYKNIKVKYSYTTKTSYTANVCEHCGSLQGRNYVVDDPHEIMGSLYHNKDMEQYFIENIAYDKVQLELQELCEAFYWNE